MLRFSKRYPKTKYSTEGSLFAPEDNGRHKHRRGKWRRKRNREEAKQALAIGW